MIFSMVACGDSDHEGEAKTPSASGAQKGRDYQSVVNDFEAKGFTNVKTETLEDLIFGWLTKDGEVESVSVGGDIGYSADKWYPNDVEVVITYHTFPKETIGDKEIEDSPDVDISNEEEASTGENNIGKRAIDVYNELEGLGYSVGFKHAVSKMDFTGEVQYSDEAERWIITDVDAYSDASKTASFFINTKEMMEEEQNKINMLDALNSKLDRQYAWQAVESYGKNEYGTWMKNLTCEAYVNGTTESPNVSKFMVY